MRRGELRQAALDRAGGRCQFPGCQLPPSVFPLEMAHLEATGMGGSPDRDRLDNVVILCSHHHDWLDCRITPNARRFENQTILASYVGM